MKKMKKKKTQPKNIDTKENELSTDIHHNETLN